MFPKERKRAKWSIAVGAVIAGLVGGGSYLQALDANHRTRILVSDCEKQPIEPPLPKGFVLDCEPDALLDRHNLPVLETKIVETAREADNDRADGRRYALFVFLIFCLPLAWYLVLDRIRELSAAISGRDRSP